MKRVTPYFYVFFLILNENTPFGPSSLRSNVVFAALRLGTFYFKQRKSGIKKPIYLDGLFGFRIELYEFTSTTTRP